MQINYDKHLIHTLMLIWPSLNAWKCPFLLGTVSRMKPCLRATYRQTTQSSIPHWMWIWTCGMQAHDMLAILPMSTQCHHEGDPVCNEKNSHLTSGLCCGIHVTSNSMSKYLGKHYTVYAGNSCRSHALTKIQKLLLLPNLTHIP